MTWLRRSKHEGSRSLEILESCKTEGVHRVKARVGKEVSTYEIRDTDTRGVIFRVRKINTRKGGKSKSAYNVQPRENLCECEGRQRGYRCRHLAILEALAERGIL